MQLGDPARPGALRSRIGAGVCALLASASPALAQSETTPGTQFETSALVYGEQYRVKVFEPMARITRVLSGGQSMFVQFGLDVISGASPTGAVPSAAPSGEGGEGGGDGRPSARAGRPERIQTTTAASGGVGGEGQLPSAQFNDLRGSLDLGVAVPLASRVTPSLGGHLSREKDYRSLGGNGSLALDLFHRRTTLTLGGGFYDDRVSPQGGIVIGLTDGIPSGETTSERNVKEGLVGLSQVVSRRWLLGVSASQSREDGYLTEPYKVLSLIDAQGVPVSSVREKRPDTRRRNSVTLASVYHLTRDVLHASYREYWDGWGVRSHTVDLSLRHELSNDQWLEPHLRYYTQSEADFFRFSLNQGVPLPAYASADQRLGPLHSATIGAGYGFRPGSGPGEVHLRAEYLVQWGDGHPQDAVGIQREIDLMPTVNIGSLTVSYSR